MSYSNQALALRKPTVIELPRVGDRISFLYLDLVQIRQDQTGVIALGDDGSKLQIPVASISVILLGPGSSISTPALTSLHRAGACIITTSDNGSVGISSARPLTSRSRWAEAQARMWAVREHRIAAARTLYRLRYPELKWPDEMPLNVMRGVEGSQVKNQYRELCKKYRLIGWKRETDSSVTVDPVNPLLNLGNSILYGTALAACSALALNPALGIVHSGAAGALLFDLADMHKARSSIPLAFELQDSPDAAKELRRRMRRYLQRNRVLDGHVQLLAQILDPHLQDDAGDRLLDDTGDVAGHKNYSVKES